MAISLHGKWPCWLALDGLDYNNFSAGRSAPCYNTPQSTGMSKQLLAMDRSGSAGSQIDMPVYWQSCGGSTSRFHRSAPMLDGISTTPHANKLLDDNDDSYASYQDVVGDSDHGNMMAYNCESDSEDLTSGNLIT